MLQNFESIPRTNPQKTLLDVVHRKYLLALMQVTEKEEEKATLLTMCNELMNKLEREGISL